MENETEIPVEAMTNPMYLLAAIDMLREELDESSFGSVMAQWRLWVLESEYMMQRARVSEVYH